MCQWVSVGVSGCQRVSVSTVECSAHRRLRLGQLVRRVVEAVVGRHGRVAELQPHDVSVSGCQRVSAGVSEYSRVQCAPQAPAWAAGAARSRGGGRAARARGRAPAARCECQWVSAGVSGCQWVSVSTVECSAHRRLRLGQLVRRVVEAVVGRHGRVAERQPHDLVRRVVEAVVGRHGRVAERQPHDVSVSGCQRVSAGVSEYSRVQCAPQAPAWAAGAARSRGGGRAARARGRAPAARCECQWVSVGVSGCQRVSVSTVECSAHRRLRLGQLVRRVVEAVVGRHGRVAERQPHDVSVSGCQRVSVGVSEYSRVQCAPQAPAWAAGAARSRGGGRAARARGRAPAARCECQWVSVGVSEYSRVQCAPQAPAWAAGAARSRGGGRAARARGRAPAARCECQWVSAGVSGCQ
ncbi:unnamed protein product [Euphydryas editha]|uniref:Uncharacterized protein n=1 Tax=Euphydryas editha TaxID=104508 RepID=A0AAU9UTT2_EUPED|nr:unnamed protein product [Euphydryas editha]